MENQNENTTGRRDGHTESIWQAGASHLNYDSTPASTKEVFDVLIIGGGITGITTGLLLQRAGQRCLLVEGKNIGFGTTGGTSAHLNTFFDATYPEIERDFGADAVKLVAEAGKTAFSMIGEFARQYQIDCDFEYKDAYLFSQNEKESKQLEDILQASRKAGIQVVEERDNGVPLPFELSILFKEQGQFHPLKYITRLAEEFKKAGGQLIGNTFIHKTDFKEGIHLAESDDLIFKAKNLVYATHIPPGINLLDFRCAPYRSYVLGIKLKDDDYPESLSYDMQDPYHYFRTHVIDGQKYLILGGEDHKTGHEDPGKSFNNLEAYARKYYNVASVDYKWSAQYYIPADGLPYIGHLPGAEERVFAATGYNGNGMIFGTLAGKIISDQILGNINPYSELFSPSRIKPVAGFSEFVKENADVAYHFVADRFSADELDTLNELKPDQGIIADYKGQQLAIYKDRQGDIHALNPVCTHAGCIVKFNDAEKSWDCPCHGGRYDINGKVLTGPPSKDLQSFDLDKKD